MRNINRIDLFLESIKEQWKKMPDIRFGQLICNILNLKDTQLFYIEDDKFLELLDKDSKIIKYIDK